MDLISGTTRSNPVSPRESFIPREIDKSVKPTDLGDEEAPSSRSRPPDGQRVQRGERHSVEAALRDSEPEGRPRGGVEPRQQQRSEDGEDRGEEEAAAVHPLSPDHIRRPPPDDHGADLSSRERRATNDS